MSTWTQRQLAIAIAALTHGMQRGRDGARGASAPARDVLKWIETVEAEFDAS